jgi:hypothetical protein
MATKRKLTEEARTRVEETRTRVEEQTRVEETVDAPQRLPRRKFTKTVAAAMLAAPVLIAQTPPAKNAPKAPPETPPPTPPQQPPPPPSALAVMYAAVAQIRFGEHLSKEEFENVKRDLEGNVRTADRLRAFKLQNSDEPDFVFGA